MLQIYKMFYDYSNKLEQFQSNSKRFKDFTMISIVIFSKCLDYLFVILLKGRAECKHVTNERVNTQGGARK